MNYSTNELLERINLNKINKTSILDLSDIMIDFLDLTHLSSLIHLKELKISSSVICDFEWASNLINLEVLSIIPTSHNIGYNWAGFEIPRSSIVSLSPLSDLIKLRVLDINNIYVDDLSPIINNIHLEKLCFACSQHVDLNLLSNFDKLVEIGITEYNSKNLSPISKLKNLLKLHIENSKIEDYSELKNLHLLEYLNINIRRKSSENFTFFENLTQLKSLLIKGAINTIEFESITKLKGLEELKLNVQKIRNLSHLKNLQNLQRLDLSEIISPTINWLNYCENLEEITIHGLREIDISHISNLPHLKKLHLRYDEIKNIEKINQFTKLQILEINTDTQSYADKNIEEHLSTLRSLVELKLKSTNIKSLNFLKELPLLKKLSIESSQLTMLDCPNKTNQLEELILTVENTVDISSIEKLGGLLFLSLDATEIISLNSLSSLKNLKELKLDTPKSKANLVFLNSLNNLRCLILKVKELENSHKLEVLNNISELELQLSSLDKLSFIKNLTSLQFLNLSIKSSHELKDLTPFSSLIDLRGLAITDKINKIESLNGVASLTKLILLKIENHRFNFIGYHNYHKHDNQINIEEVVNLKNLISLTLRRYGFKNLNTLSNLKKLRFLNIGAAKNTTIDLSPLSSSYDLHAIFIDNNNPTDFSPLCHLKQLKFLHISGRIAQNLKTLESQSSLDYLMISRAASLKEEDLKSITNIPNLQNFNLFNFDEPTIEGIPPELIAHYDTLSALKSYFNSIKNEGFSHIYESKLLILGEPGAGKTSLMRKIINIESELQNEESTHGINLKEWPFPFTNPKGIKCKDDYDKIFKTLIFDFGGQDILQPSHRYFMRNRCVYILVVNARESDKFDYYTWLKSIRYYGGKDSPIFILLNNKEQEVIPTEVEKKWIDDFKVDKVFHIDLKNNMNVIDAISTIKKSLQSLPHVGKEKFLNSWIKIRDVLREKAKTNATLYYNEYLDIWKSLNNDEYTAKHTIKLFDLLGEVLYFHNKETLKHTIILNKEWATEASYQVFWDPSTRKNFGRFNYSDLKEILNNDKKFPPQQYNFLLSLMDNFGVAYNAGKNNNEDSFIVPALLPINPPPEYKDLKSNDKRCFRLMFKGFMPQGIISLFIVRAHEYIHEGLQWKKGVVLNLKKLVGATSDIFCEVKEIREKTRQEIFVKVMGSQKREALSILYKQFLKGVLKELDVNDQLKPILEIGCSCSVCQELKEPHFFEYQYLLELANDGEDEDRCKKSRKQQNIRDLLFEFDLENSNNGKLENYLLELKKGVSDLQDGVSDLQDGVSDLQDGVSDLQDGVSDTQEGISDLQDGVLDVQENISVINTHLNSFLNEFKEYKESSTKDLDDKIKDLEKLIDKQRINNLDKYKSEVKLLLSNYSTLQNDSITFLASGFYYLQVTPLSGDFAAAALQFCRGLELEMKTLCLGFKNSLTTPSYGSSSRYTTLKEFVLSNSFLTFGQLKDIFDHLLSDVPVTASSTPPILIDFNYYLSSILDIQGTPSNYSSFVSETKALTNKVAGTDYRNKAAHTEVLNKSQAEDCKNRVFRALNFLLNAYK